MAFDGYGEPGSVVALRPGNVSVLRPAEQLFDDMLAGWADQQSSRLLSSTTIRTREAQLGRFATFCGSSPWEWSASDVEEWTTELLAGPRPLTPSTIRAYQNAVALFCSYLTDARYGWVDQCMELLGTHPVQVCHEWNTAIHVADHEARPAVRPLTRAEVQTLFDHADDPRRDRRRPGGRDGGRSRRAADEGSSLGPSPGLAASEFSTATAPAPTPHLPAKRLSTGVDGGLALIAGNR